MLEALCAGEQEANKLAELARGHLRSKLPELREALLGHVTEHHRFMLTTLMQHLRSLEELEAQLSARIELLVQHSEVQVPPAASAQAGGAGASDLAPASAEPLPSAEQSSDEGHPCEPKPSEQEPSTALAFSEAVKLLDTLPGVDQRAAQCLVAELGNDMAQFPSSANLASWAKVCPGNNESAGKRKASSTGKGNRWLRRALSQAACSAGRLRKSYFSAQFRRIAARRGKARAVMAVAHSLLVAIYYMLSRRVPFQDLGPDFFERRDPQRLTRSLVRRLEALGHQVILQPQEASP
jgi:transposase